MNNLHKQFRNPSKDFRSAPFWAWNDKLSKSELIRQAKDMKTRGMGGFFMHSRDGLETEYLGNEWMDCIKATVAQARKSGMNAWLYDEDRWPFALRRGPREIAVDLALRRIVGGAQHHARRLGLQL